MVTYSKNSTHIKHHYDVTDGFSFAVDRAELNALGIKNKVGTDEDGLLVIEVPVLELEDIRLHREDFCTKTGTYYWSLNTYNTIPERVVAWLHGNSSFFTKEMRRV